MIFLHLLYAPAQLLGGALEDDDLLGLLGRGRGALGKLALEIETHGRKRLFSPDPPIPAPACTVMDAREDSASEDDALDMEQCQLDDHSGESDPRTSHTISAVDDSTRVASRLALCPNKAGREGVDKARINAIILEASKV